MRIVHVTATFPPYRAGTGNVCFYSSRELARRGHHVRVVTGAVPGTPARELIEGVEVYRLPPLLQVGNAPLLPRLIGELRGFDVIHLHYPFILGAELVALASAIHHTPLVLSFHNDLIGDGARAPIFSLYQRLSALLVVRRAARLCVVSNDHFQSSRLSRSVPNRPEFVVEVPNGVDARCFAPTGPRIDLRRRYGIPRSARLALFVAALDRAHHFKGLGTLIEAMRHLPESVWLLVVGDGDLRRSYEVAARRLGVHDRTIFVGATDHRETAAFFRSADVTVLPSVPPESFGLVLIESLACGTPVVAHGIPGVRTVVENGSDGLLVEPNRPTALADAIWTILSDRALGREMGRRGRAKVEQRYRWERIAERLDAIYGEVTHQPNRSTPAIAVGSR